jgi:hypothetical protein
MPTDELSIVEREAQAHREIVKAFPTLENFGNQVVQLGELILENQSPIAVKELELRKSDLVCRYLFLRIMTDIFAIFKLAFSGYSLQATTLASSSFETAFMIIYVGDDNIKAEEWLNNKNPFKSVVSVKNSIKKALEHTGLVDSQLVDDYYKVYQQMCGAKHPNVNTQGIFQHRHVKDGIQLEYGPNTASHHIYNSVWTLVEFFRLFLGCTGEIVKHHIDQDKKDKILVNFRALLSQFKELDKNISDYAKKNGINNDTN